MAAVETSWPQSHELLTQEPLHYDTENSLHELIGSIPDGAPPAVPKKSSRRRLQRLNTQDIGATSMFASPTDSERALDNAIEHLENANLNGDQHRRLPSYSSAESSPVEMGSSSEPRSSMSSQTTWSDPPPDYSTVHPEHRVDEKRVSTVLSDTDKELLKAEYPDPEADLTETRSLSVYSGVDGAADFDIALPSQGSKTLYINAAGMHSFRFPLPSNELEIQIANPDGSVAYISSRSNRFNADASLSKPGFGEFVRTHYGKKTLMTCRHSEAATSPFMISGGGLRRRQSFTLPGVQNGNFEWRYASAKVNGKREERLVLVQKPAAFEPAQTPAVAPAPEQSKTVFSRRRLSRAFSTSQVPTEWEEKQVPAAPTQPTKKQKGKAPKVAPRVLAQLSRSDLSLQGYSKKPRQSMRAGIGGELIMEPGCTDLVPEEVVVASALVMMKREQDRLRAVQTAVIVTVLL